MLKKALRLFNLIHIDNFIGLETKFQSLNDKFSLRNKENDELKNRIKIIETELNSLCESYKKEGKILDIHSTLPPKYEINTIEEASTLILNSSKLIFLQRLEYIKSLIKK
jgi:adenylate kinase family enzyme